MIKTSIKIEVNSIKNYSGGFLAFLLLALFFSGQIHAQHRLKVEVSSPASHRLSLYTIHGDKYLFLDSLQKIGDQIYEYVYPADFTPGMYRLSFAPKSFADLILNQESVHIRTSLKTPMDSMKVIQSNENKLYYDFLHLKKDYRLKMDLLNPLVMYYPESDAYYRSSMMHFLTIQTDYKEALDSLIQSLEGSFAARYMSFYYEPLLAPGLSEDEQTDFLQVHFFDRMRFDDASMLLSDVYPTKLVEYLSLFTQTDMSREAMSREFKRAIDLLMSRSMPEPLVRDYIYQYLLDGFQQYGFDEVIAHMANNYQLAEPCENEALKSDLKTRLEQFQKLAIGKKAPDFSLPDINGKMVTLSKIKSPYRLLFFYSMNCPHCMELMPKLNEWYELQEDKRVEVIAVSLDQDKEIWKEFVHKIGNSWKDVCDGKAWESEAVKLYNLYATPTVYVIDSEGKIVGKPLLNDEIRAWFGGDKNK